MQVLSISQIIKDAAAGKLVSQIIKDAAAGKLVSQIIKDAAAGRQSVIDQALKDLGSRS